MLLISSLQILASHLHDLVAHISRTRRTQVNDQLTQSIQEKAVIYFAPE